MVTTSYSGCGLPPMTTNNYVRRSAVHPPRARARRGYTCYSSLRISDESSGFSGGGGGRQTYIFGSLLCEVLMNLRESIMPALFEEYEMSRIILSMSVITLIK
eukprot:162815_1